LEYTDWSAPLLAEPYKVEDGHVLIPDAPGVGIEWNEDTVEKYSIDV
jgi:mandelate racemase